MKTTNGKPQLTERDTEILRLVFEHRYLDAELLSRMLTLNLPSEHSRSTGRDGKSRPSTYGFGQSALRKRLKALSDSRYLKPFRRHDKPTGRGIGSQGLAYGIDIKAVPVLSQSTGADSSALRQQASQNLRVDSRFVAHALGIARFRVLIELACRDSGGAVRLLAWKQGQSLFDSVTIWNDEGDEERIPVCPDAAFVLESRETGRACYFLEYDRGTMAIESSSRTASNLKRKFVGYWHYRKQEKHKGKYFYAGTSASQSEDFLVADAKLPAEGLPHVSLRPVRYFRVLFLLSTSANHVSPHNSRLQNILERFPYFGKELSTSTLFWFANESQLDFNRPLSVFDEFWLTPNSQHGPKSLVR